MKHTVEMGHAGKSKLAYLEAKGFVISGYALTNPDTKAHAWVDCHGLVLWPRTEDEVNAENQLRRATDLKLIDEMHEEITLLKEEVRYLDQLMKAK